MSPWFTDAYLLRFCRARNFQVDKIKEMWSNFIKFRQDNDCDNILNTVDASDLEFSQKVYEKGYFGVDKVGRPVYIDRCASADLSVLKTPEDEELMMKTYIWSYEDFLKRKCPASSLLYDLNIM